MGIGLLIGDAQTGAQSARDVAAHFYLEGDRRLREVARRLGLASNELSDALEELRKLIGRG